ncbi:Uncharacterised protein [uncultured archaeon]|nr:Uncharacterised protein [uncultured archaeon]
MSHGMIVVLETQSLDLPKDLGNPLRYTVHVKMKWKSTSDTLRKVPGFIGGICDVHDHFNNFHSESVITRPPLTSYSV